MQLLGAVAQARDLLDVDIGHGEVLFKLHTGFRRVHRHRNCFAGVDRGLLKGPAECVYVRHSLHFNEPSIIARVSLIGH